MKRKSLLLILLMAFMVPLAMNAQGLISASHNNLQEVAAIKGDYLEKALTRDAGYLYYQIDSLYGFVSLGLTTYTYGVMYPSDMLTDNNTIDTVSFLQGSSMTGDIEVNFYSGGDEAPANLIHTETVTTTGETGWIDLDLTAEAVNFDPEQNLWITFTVAGNYPLFWAYLSDANDLNDTWFYYYDWYYLKDLNSSFAGYGWYVFTYVDYTSFACAIPTNLTVSDITTSTATLSWGSMGEETAYQVVYGEQGFDPDDATPIDVTERTYALTGLTDDTDYEAYVRSNCGDGSYSAWSAVVSFYTPWLCDKPFNLETSDVTYQSANLSWDGWQDTYNVQYTPMSKTWEADFSNGIPDDWTTIDNDGDENNWTAGDGYVYSASWISGTGALTPDNILVTPKITMGGKLYITAYGMDPDYAEEVFAVYYSTRGGTNINRYTKISEDFVATGEPTIYEIDLSRYSGEAYIAIRHYNVTDMYRLVVSEMFTATAGETVTVENVTSPYTMELTEDTFYTVQVQGNCPEGETDWSDTYYFTSGTGNVFITNGEWNEASNWKNNVVPGEGEDATINANCVIPSDYIAVAGNVAIGEEGSLTIKDGGQLIHTNEGVVATVQKEIAGYTGDKDNYYLISTPVYNQDVVDYNGEGYELFFPDEVTNMLENNYDLYSFDYAADDGLEWRNYKNEEFYLWRYEGYLYANSEDVTLEFTGVTTPAYTDLYYLTGYYLPYTEDEYSFANWNLYGNPFLCNTYIWVYDYTNKAFYSYDHYQMNEDGNEIIQSDDPLAPMQGAFFIPEGASQYVLVAVAEAAIGKKSFGQSLAINLTQNGRLIDAARVRFGETAELSKLQLNPSHTKLFLTRDGKDLAVANAESNTGEMPVSFKAEKNGTYTLSVNNENVEFSYLHLIDNMTGADVDLLANPSYSFEARTTDYATRFKLVFSAGATANADDFAFVSNGNLKVFGVEGNAILKVIDVTGRTLSTESFNGSYDKRLNLSNGVYMIQLIQGSDIKTQKIVVR